MAIRSRNKVSPNFNMSSMTDIVFLLLIFFMLTSTLVSPNALKVLLPSSSSKTLAKQSISVSITKDMEYFINKTKVSFETFEPFLMSEVSKYDEPSIIIHAEKSLPLEEVVKVLEIGSKNKLKMSLATKPS